MAQEFRCSVVIYPDRPDECREGPVDHVLVGVVETEKRDYPVEIWCDDGNWWLKVDHQEVRNPLPNFAVAHIVGVTACYALARSLYDQAIIMGE